MNPVTFKRTNSDDADFRILTHELDADLRTRNGELMDIYDQHNIIEPIDTVIIAYLDGAPAGCGCFKDFDEDTVEIKRMFVRTMARGKGISATILQYLENWAIALGYNQTVLETGSRQVEALHLYQKSGYTRIVNYGPYIHLTDSVCFGKNLKA